MSPRADLGVRGPIGSVQVLPVVLGSSLVFPPDLRFAPLTLGTFDPTEGWTSGFDETGIVHSGLHARQITPLLATQRIFNPVIDVSGTDTLHVWTYLRDDVPGFYQANLVLTMYDEDFNQKVVSFPLAFNSADGSGVWIERSTPVEWFPLDTMRFRIAIFALQVIGFGGASAFIDDWNATPGDRSSPVPAPELADDFDTGHMSVDWGTPEGTGWGVGYEMGHFDDSPRETPDTSPNVVFIDAPDRPGEKCWSLTIQPDDYTTQATKDNHRQKAYMRFQRTGVGLPGSIWWFAISIRVPTGHVLDNIGSGSKWQIYWEIHSDGVTGGPQPVISLRHEADGTETGDLFFLRCGLIEQHGNIQGEDPNAGGEAEHRIYIPSIARNTWNDLMMQVGFFPGNGNGFVELYHQGNLVTDVRRNQGGVYVPTGTTRAIVGTMYNSQPQINSVGFYCGADPTRHTVARTVLHGRVRAAQWRQWLRLP